MLVSAPMATFMDRIAFVQTIRDRIYLKSKGLSLPDSKCDKSADDLVRLNLRLIDGSEALDMVVEYSELLEAHPDSELIKPCGVTFAEMLPKVFTTMCDAFRRLVLPSLRSKFRFLNLGVQPVQEAARFVRDFASEPLCCSGYPFVQAPGISQNSWWMSL